MLITSCTILDIGFEWPLRLPQRYKRRGARCRTPHLAISIFSELEKNMPFLATDVEAPLAPLPVMASGGDRGTHP
jgi:hypothetical protein